MIFLLVFFGLLFLFTLIVSYWRMPFYVLPPLLCFSLVYTSETFLEFLIKFTCLILLIFIFFVCFRTRGPFIILDKVLMLSDYFTSFHEATLYWRILFRFATIFLFIIFWGMAYWWIVHLDFFYTVLFLYFSWRFLS